jgi:hypothetical protein
MEIMNSLYRDSVVVLPHRPYGLLTSTFSGEPDQHAHYLGNDREEWDPVAVFNEAKYLHFSDWPVPKPWLPTPESVRLERQPKCYVRHGVESCVERELWNGFYSEFRERREASPIHARPERVLLLTALLQRVCGNGVGNRPRQRK